MSLHVKQHSCTAALDLWVLCWWGVGAESPVEVLCPAPFPTIWRDICTYIHNHISFGYIGTIFLKSSFFVNDFGGWGGNIIFRKNKLLYCGGGCEIHMG